MEIQCGALVFPAGQVQRARSELPVGALRDGRSITSYVDLEERVEDGEENHNIAKVALHLAHEAALTIKTQQERSPEALGPWVAEALSSGLARWVPGLRPLSRQCRTPAEENLVRRWGAADRRNARFTFIELFAGMGGFRVGLEALGGACAMACELDPSARAVYRANFGEPECLSDVTALDAIDLPAHDVLTAGFPCQPFAFCNVANAELTGTVREGPGVLHGSGRGVLAFEVARLLHAARPAAFILENVPNLREFNGGRDLEMILTALRGEAPSTYAVDCAVLDARDFGLCQQRRRIYFVGFRLPDHQDAASRFCWPRPSAPSRPPRLRDVLEPDDQVPADCWLSEAQWHKILVRTKGKAGRPSGRGGRLARLDGYARTLGSSYRTSDRFSEFVPRHPPKEPQRGDYTSGVALGTSLKGVAGEAEDNALIPPRFFSQRECARLQGFPETFVLAAEGYRCRDTHRFYHLVGNAVSPPVITAIGQALLAALQWPAGASEAPGQGVAGVAGA